MDPEIEAQAGDQGDFNISYSAFYKVIIQPIPLLSSSDHQQGSQSYHTLTAYCIIDLLTDL